MQGTSARHWRSIFWDTTFGVEYLTTNNNCAIPFERNTSRWPKPMRNVLSVFLKEHQIYQVPRNYSGRYIADIIHAPDVSDVKNKADEKVIGNRVIAPHQSTPRSRCMRLDSVHWIVVT